MEVSPPGGLRACEKYGCRLKGAHVERPGWVFVSKNDQVRTLPDERLKLRIERARHNEIAHPLVCKPPQQVPAIGGKSIGIEDRWIADESDFSAGKHPHEFLSDDLSDRWFNWNAA